MVGKFHGRALTLLAASTLAVSLGGSAAASVSAGAQVGSAAMSARQSLPRAGSCAFGPTGSIKHVIYIQFDNVHYTRDNPNVPSDLQQMPNLLKFITGQGTLISHEHTPLIAHTADDIVTSEPGLYAAHHGDPFAIGNPYYFTSTATHYACTYPIYTDS